MYDGASNIPDGCCSSAILISSGGKDYSEKVALSLAFRLCRFKSLRDWL